MFYNKKVMR